MVGEGDGEVRGGGEVTKYVSPLGSCSSVYDHVRRCRETKEIGFVVQAF
jgi:hypothetical protein